MTDWLERIKSVISSEKKKDEPSTPQPFFPKKTISEHADVEKGGAFTQVHFSKPASKSPHLMPPPQSGKILSPQPISPTSSSSSPTPPILKEEESKNMKSKDHTEENIKALKRLRELPRGTQVESRIAAIENLLGEGEIFKTLQMLRWPQGVICPRCHSTNVVRRDPPPNAVDKRHYYICLNCKGEGSPSDFDDFTGLPVGSLFAMRQWIMCWYLIGFCSITQIAKVLGISIAEVLKIANLGTELAELPEVSEELSAQQTQQYKKTEQERRKKATIEDQEERTRSASKAPLKPGYKSKK